MTIFDGQPTTIEGHALNAICGLENNLYDRLSHGGDHPVQSVELVSTIMHKGRKFELRVNCFSGKATLAYIGSKRYTPPFTTVHDVIEALDAQIGRDNITIIDRESFL